MADRRMFSKSVVESARFLKMPVSSQCLYIHLGLNADDDGIVEAYPVMNLVKAHEDDLRVLYSKGFIKILNEDLVSYIADWREQNKIRPDRKKDSIYKKLLLQMEPDVDLLEAKPRSDVIGKKSGPSMDGNMSAQCSEGKFNVDKVNVGQYRSVECTGEAGHNTQIRYQLDDEKLMEQEYQSLVNRYGASAVDGVISRILGKPYHGCLNTRIISGWCEEHNTASRPETAVKSSMHSDQLMKLAAERKGVNV